jgi:hypothetical protein
MVPVKRPDRWIVAIALVAVAALAACEGGAAAAPRPGTDGIAVDCRATYDYDPFGRPTTVALPLGTVTYTDGDTSPLGDESACPAGARVDPPGRLTAADLTGSPGGDRRWERC